MAEERPFVWWVMIVDSCQSCFELLLLVPLVSVVLLLGVGSDVIVFVCVFVCVYYYFVGGWRYYFSSNDDYN